MNKSAIEIFKDKKDQFRFRVVAKNGEIICQSEAYVTKAKCKNGIYALDAAVIGSEIVDLTTRKGVKP